jgi:hypothetical protein
MQNHIRWQPDSYPEGGDRRSQGRGSLGQFIERSTSAPPATAIADPTGDALVGNVSRYVEVLLSVDTNGGEREQVHGKGR